MGKPMIVHNYMKDFNWKSPEIFLHFLVSSIPRCLRPKNGFPGFYLANTLFHLYGVMYRRHNPSGMKKEEDSFDFNRKYNVWAFTLWCRRPFGETMKGDVYLALRERVEKQEKTGFEYGCTIEHVVFHEIGHQFYIGNGIVLGESDAIDFEHEFLANIYANACMINLHKKHKDYNGYYFPFPKRTKNLLEKTEKMKVNSKNILSVAEMIHKNEGVI